MTQWMQHLAQEMANKREVLSAWFAAQYRDTPTLLYSSVDIRNSGYKVAPVDTNIYPAGFNNLSDAALQYGAQAVQDYLRQHYPDAKRLAIIPENHTRNAGYIANLIALHGMIAAAGFEVVVGRLEEGVSEPVTLLAFEEETIISHPLQLSDGQLQTMSGFVPDVLVMNMDMTSGVPELLQQATQPVIPSTALGWYQRRKSIHFDAYAALAQELAAQLGVDAWLLSAIHQRCGRVNFKERTGLECVALNVERVLHTLRERYAQYGITDEPYVFIKADSGTYGMGIMTARSGDDVLAMNKKIRNKMDVIKEGAVNTEVIIQEGVPTIVQQAGRVAEPFMYLVGGQVIGGIWRINDTRDAFVSLNASGVVFEPMAEDARLAYAHGDVLVYSVISMLASLAAAKESY